LRARGELVAIRSADLRFTRAEAAAYLGPAVSEHDVATLESRTEGWIAALQFAALSMQGREDVAGFRPIALSRQAPADGSVVRIAGYGATSHADPLKPSGQLHTGQFTVSAVSASVVGVKGLAPSPETSACPFDSGAPYFAARRFRAPVLISVESDGPACPHAEEETTSRVDAIADWIHQAIRE
jgi:hypothetical protein